MLTGLLIVLLPYGMIIPGTLTKCDVGGYYIVETQTAYVCNIGSDAHKEYVKHHETGHYVWFELYTDKERKMYTKLYQRALKQGIEAFPSAYAMSNVEESFAEDYARYKLNYSYPRQMASRISFIKRIGK